MVAGKGPSSLRRSPAWLGAPCWWPSGVIAVAFGASRDGPASRGTSHGKKIIGNNLRISDLHLYGSFL